MKKADWIIVLGVIWMIGAMYTGKGWFTEKITFFSFIGLVTMTIFVIGGVLALVAFARLEPDELDVPEAKK